MTHEDQYVPYLLSRFFAGFFGVVVSVLGPAYLVDMFFLHHRGRAFTVLHLALNFGASAGPTFSGFVAMRSYWTVEYWWQVGVTAITLVVVFLFLEDTTFDRVGTGKGDEERSWLKGRFDTFFFGTKVVRSVSGRGMVCLCSVTGRRCIGD